jgi:hypothetical protein
MKKTKHGDYQVKIHFSVLSGYDIYIVITEDLEKSTKSRYPYSSHSLMGTDAITYRAESGDGHIFMQLKTLYKPYYCAGILAHEAWHAVRDMLRYIGIGGLREIESEVPLENEIVAYHLGYTVERATKFFEEVRREQSKHRASRKKCS